MPTLYDILGVAEDADGAELRRAYYRAARRLHPDVNLDVDTTEDMRLLNRAWTVLSDPEARRVYDSGLHRPAPSPSPDPDPDLVSFDAEPVYPDGPIVSSLARLVRPSALILAVLLVIFVVTAYAGPKSNDRSGIPTPTTATGPPGPVAPSDHVGQCLKLLPGYDAVVPCSGPNDGRVVAEVRESSRCPTATRAYQLAGMVQIVCLDQSGR